MQRKSILIILMFFCLHLMSGCSSKLKDKSCLNCISNMKETVRVGINPNYVRQKLFEKISLFRSCYQEKLDISEKRLSGGVVLNFAINKNGKVRNVIISSRERKDQKVLNCIKHIVESIVFDQSKVFGAVEIIQPMNLYIRKNN